MKLKNINLTKILTKKNFGMLVDINKNENI